MSKPLAIQSAAQFADLLKSSRFVVADFYADWCGPCKQIAPLFDQLSQSLSKPNVATFVKIDIESEGGKALASQYSVTSLPTFIIFRDGKVHERVKAADPKQLEAVLNKLSSDIESAGDGGAGGSSGGVWRGAEVPRGYSDISDQVDVKGLELLNAEAEFSVRTLLAKEKPTALSKGKSTSTDKDWVESDTDEQLLLFAPFNSAVKLHTLQITSVPPEAEEDEDEDELPMRPSTIKLFINKPHNLGFDEAEDMVPTQEIEVGEDDWNANGTANIPLRFVRFQNVSSLVIFIVDGDGDSEKVRVDRVRLIGETGEKREMGKLEKIGDEPGE